jgi:hypothetical protein
MQNWHLLYNSATGASVSIGTVIADPLPAGITALPLSDTEGEGLQNGSLKWDEATRTLIATPPPAMRAEEYLESVGLGGNRQPTLLYLRQAGAVSPKLDATEQYLNTVLAMFAADPAPRSDWPAAPFTFEQVVAEAVSSLTASDSTLPAPGSTLPS